MYILSLTCPFNLTKSQSQNPLLMHSNLKMCLRNNPYQRSVFWDEDGNLVHFKYRLPAGTKQEDVKVGIDEDGKLLITIISKMVNSHTGLFAPASCWMNIFVSYFLSLLKIKEGDTTISTKFHLPAGINTNGFKTAIDDEGLLTLTFKKLLPIDSETPFNLRKVSINWKNEKNVFHFKAYLAAGTKMEDMIVGIEGRKYLLIGIRHLRKKKEGDTCTRMCFNGKNFRRFILPDGVNPNGFKTAMDDAGVLAVTFTKLKPKKKKVGPIANEMLERLAPAVPAAFSLICDKICNAIFSGN